MNFSSNKHCQNFGRVVVFNLSCTLYTYLGAYVPLISDTEVVEIGLYLYLWLQKVYKTYKFQSFHFLTHLPKAKSQEPNVMYVILLRSLQDFYALSFYFRKVLHGYRNGILLHCMNLRTTSVPEQASLQLVVVLECSSII